METIGQVILYIIIGLLIGSMVYLALWQPRNRCKGYAGKKCRCCEKDLPIK